MENSFNKTVSYNFTDTLKRVEESLDSEGFNVVTEIDVTGIMKKKLDVDFRNYRILGACNPPFALESLDRDLSVGLFMPCNVIIYEEEDGKVTVSAIDIATTMGMIFPLHMDLAINISERLKSVIDSL